MGDAPERIFAWPGGKYQRVSLAGGRPDDMVEYIRADLADAQVMANEKVRKLVEALRRCLNYIQNTESELGITLDCADMARAVLRDLEAP